MKKTKYISRLNINLKNSYKQNFHKVSAVKSPYKKCPHVRKPCTVKNSHKKNLTSIHGQTKINQEKIISQIISLKYPYHQTKHSRKKSTLNMTTDEISTNKTTQDKTLTD